MTVGCSYRSSPVNNASTSTESEPPLRRSARLQEPTKKLKRQPKQKPKISISTPKSNTELSPRALRLQKRNREPEEFLVTHPISPLKKRKSRVSTDSEVLVVKKKLKEESPRIKQPQNASPPSSPPLNPATYPIALDIVDIGPSACPPITDPTPTPQTPTELDLPFDSTVLFAPQSSSDSASPQQPQEWPEQQHHPQPEILLPPPRRPRQQPLWVMACKLRVFEVEKYYPRNVIRSIVAQQANDYYSVHGPPPRSWKVWNPHVDDSIADNQPSSQEHVQLTSEDEEDVFCPGSLVPDAIARAKPQEPEDDTDDEEEEDSDESEGYGGDVMQLDLPAAREDGFNAELTSSISYDSDAPFNEWSQPISPLMTTFALPPSEQQSSSQLMLPPPTPYPTPLSAASMFTETLPSMMFMPMFPVSLPRLSSVKVMSLRSMFDVISSPMEEEDDSDFSEQLLGISQDGLRAQRRRRRREGVGNGTPVDPYRRAIWASAGRDGDWMDDFGVGLGLDEFHVPSNTMQMDLNPLLSGNMEGAVKQFAALQQVYEVFNGGTPTGYST